jgi:GxxExxY protein
VDGIGVSRQDAKNAKSTASLHEDQIGRIAVDAAVHLHRELGPGLLESVYEATLAHELHRRGLWVERQVPIEIEYKGISVGEGFART